MPVPLTRHALLAWLQGPRISQHALKSEERIVDGLNVRRTAAHMRTQHHSPVLKGCLAIHTPEVRRWLTSWELQAWTTGYECSSGTCSATSVNQTRERIDLDRMLAYARCSGC